MTRSCQGRRSSAGRRPHDGYSGRERLVALPAPPPLLLLLSPLLPAVAGRGAAGRRSSAAAAAAARRRLHHLVRQLNTPQTAHTGHTSAITELIPRQDRVQRLRLAAVRGQELTVLRSCSSESIVAVVVAAG